MSQAPLYKQRGVQVGAIAGMAALIVGGLVGRYVLAPYSPATLPRASAAQNCPVANPTAATIQAAVKACANGLISLPAGTFKLTNHVAVNQPVTISGAGPTLTHLIQTARVNIFQISAPGVTIENMDVNTAQYNPGVPPIQKNPVPATIFSNADNTHILNLDSEAGTGFGFRITGGSPCDSFPLHGTVVTNVNSTNTGGGGFTALDIDCTNGAVLSNIAIHGDYIAFYQDENVSLIGETSTPNVYNGKCTAPWYISGPSNHLLMENVASNGGGGISKASKRGPVTFLTIVSNTKAPGC
jgi:hypothetical protein